MSILWGTSPVNELIDKATSELLPANSENLALNLEICDQIRSKQIPAKEAMRSLKRRMDHKNPNVQLLTLALTDTCVKNGGNHFLLEVSSREFMDCLVGVLKRPTGCNPEVRNKLLTLIQTWALATKGKQGLSYLGDTYNLLKAEGFSFPPPTQADAIMLETEAAPEWTESDVCTRCRTPFTLTNRKHHCRNCGQTYCQQCSSRNMALPHLGINQEVRVCDGCWMKLRLKQAERKESANAQKAGIASVSSGVPPTKSTTTSAVTNDQFDDDMKRAIELSLKEEEQRKSSYGAGYVAPAAKREETKVESAEGRKLEGTDEEDDPDLAAAIAASLADMKIAESRGPSSSTYGSSKHMPQPSNLSEDEIERIRLFSTLIERMQVSAASGNDVIGGNPQVAELYERIGLMGPKLVKELEETSRRHNTFVQLHEKMISAVKLYDHLLEERVASAYSPSYSRNTMGSSSFMYPSQPASSPYGGYPAGAATSQNVSSPYNYGDRRASQSQSYPSYPNTSQEYPPVNSPPVPQNTTVYAGQPNGTPGAPAPGLYPQVNPWASPQQSYANQQQWQSYDQGQAHVPAASPGVAPPYPPEATGYNWQTPQQQPQQPASGYEYTPSQLPTSPPPHAAGVPQQQPDQASYPPQYYTQSDYPPQPAHMNSYQGPNGYPEEGQTYHHDTNANAYPTNHQYPGFGGPPAPESHVYKQPAPKEEAPLIEF